LIFLNGMGATTLAAQYPVFVPRMVELAPPESALARPRLTVVHARALVVVCAGVAAVFTALVVFVHGFDVAYRSPTMHDAIETFAAVIGTVAAYLLFGRYRLSGQLSDLLLALSILVLAIRSFFFSVLPAILSGGDVTRFSTWAAIVSGLLAAAGFAFAAFSSGEHPRRRTTRFVSVSFLAAPVLIAAVMDVLAPRLPVAISPALSPVQGGRELLTGQPAVLAIQLLTMGLFATAAIGFLRSVERTGDQFTATLAFATTIGAFAAFNYFLFPSLYSQWVYSGDILLFGFYLLIFAAIARELNSYWRRLAWAAALEERRRIARELHDGLAQELAFIVRQSKLLGPSIGERQLASAAERALDESRRAIDALTRPLDEPLEVSIARAGEEVATRFGAQLTLRLQEGIPAKHSLRDALRRIVREAVTNAVEHGQARHIVLSLEQSDGCVRLRVEDDGTGFDPASPSSGFGLIGIRERAASLGGSLVLRSEPGAGTTLEVALP
jgi:signal transduction histidine kinase